MGGGNEPIHDNDKVEERYLFIAFMAVLTLIGMGFILGVLLAITL